MSGEEAGKQAEVAAELRGRVTANFKHRQLITTVNLRAWGSTHRTLVLDTQTTQFNSPAIQHVYMSKETTIFLTLHRKFHPPSLIINDRCDWRFDRQTFNTQ